MFTFFFKRNLQSRRRHDLYHVRIHYLFQKLGKSGLKNSLKWRPDVFLEGRHVNIVELSILFMNIFMSREILVVVLFRFMVRPQDGTGQDSNHWLCDANDFTFRNNYSTVRYLFGWKTFKESLHSLCNMKCTNWFQL